MWNCVWLSVLCCQVCGSFSARAGVQAHVKMHHAHTNVIGLGDSSTWKIPFLPRSVYLFIAPLAVPIITPVVGMGERCLCVCAHVFWSFCKISLVKWVFLFDLELSRFDIDHRYTTFAIFTAHHHPHISSVVILCVLQVNWRVSLGFRWHAQCFVFV